MCLKEINMTVLRQLQSRYLMLAGIVVGWPLSQGWHIRKSVLLEAALHTNNIKVCPCLLWCLFLISFVTLGCGLHGWDCVGLETFGWSLAGKQISPRKPCRCLLSTNKNSALLRSIEPRNYCNLGIIAKNFEHFLSWRFVSSSFSVSATSI